MALSTLQTLTTLAVALGGLLIAGLSLYFTWRERTAQYRHSLYAAQLAACTELVGLVYQLHWATDGLLQQSTIPLTPDARAAFGGLTQGDALAQHLFKNSALLPSSILRAAEEYAADLYISVDTDRPAVANELLESATAHLLQVVELTREHLGIDALSAETLRRIGQRSDWSSSSG